MNVGKLVNSYQRSFFLNLLGFSGFVDNVENVEIGMKKLTNDVKTAIFKEENYPHPK